MRKSILKIICACLCICPLFGAAACGKVEKTRMTRTYLEFFDTVSQITGYESDEAVFESNCEKIYSLLEEYHKLTDIYHSYAEMNNARTINKNAGIEPVAVDGKLIELLLFAKDMYSRTDGLCNIAMGSVLSIWHRYREAGIDDPVNAALPTIEELRSASEHCDINKIIIDKEAGTVFLSEEGMSLDLGAVAKGYAVERAAQELVQNGVKTGYALNIGGNVRTIGHKADGSDWSAGIQNPDTSSGNSYVVSIPLTDSAVVTSGDYQRYYEVGGARYHHIINPNTLFPENYFRSVSIIIPDSGIGDALSTALFNLTVEEGKNLLANFEGAEAFWIMNDESWQYTDGLKINQNQ